MPSITTIAWLCASLLSWSPLAAAATPAAADFYVKDLPGLPKDGPVVKMHAGHIEITPEHNGNLFFWHFQNQHIANKQRTVIWLNGGPGCSSEDGALMEIGPYRVNDQKNLIHNNGSWNEFANLLFVDNPVGTGFSYIDTDSYVTELEEMAKQFIQFLEQWFEIFPEYALDDLYIAGESYAGQHIPYITKALLERNKQKPDKAWNLSGLLIGNGWISPIQYKSYIPFAFEKGLIEKGSDNANQLSGMYRNCERLLFGSQDTAIDINDCENIMTEILSMTRRAGKDDACLNMYDVRLRDSYPSCGMNWPPDLTNINPYLRQANVTAALHIDPRKTTGWEECNGNVGSAFRRTKAKPAGTLLPDILKEVPVLLFSGAEDLICNHIGTEDFISSMQWNGGKGFEVSAGNWAPRRDWTFEGEAAGFWQEARNLTYVLFYNSSHMVPFDYPRRSRDMLDRFMKIDISSIGGQPTDSRIDGERGPETSVEGSDNSKAQKEKAQKELQEAKWLAYRRAGEVALVFVSIAAALFGYFVWRQRRKEAAYSALKGEEPNGRRHRVDDLEARAFADDGVDDISLQENMRGDDQHYGVGDDSEDEEQPQEKGKGKEKPAA